jgi:hypothetical protein
VIEKIAIGIHAVYSMATAKNRTDSPLNITQEEFFSYKEEIKGLPEEMPHDQISQNYHSARKIPDKLNAIGFMIVPLDPTQPASSFTSQDLEKLSRLEHIRWVRHLIDAGWTYAPKRNEASKQHNALVAWDEEDCMNAESVYGKSYIQKMGISKGEILSEKNRNLDRLISMAIPWLLEDAGFMMMKQ